MPDTIVLTGIVATPPRHVVTSEHLPITSFRLATTQRRFDRAQQRWVDGATNWYTVTSFRQLAANTAASVGKGDRVVVSGRLRIREWDSGERKGTNVDVEADVIGHDLAWGTSTYTRTLSSSGSASRAGSVPSESETSWPGDARPSGTVGGALDGDGDGDGARVESVEPERAASTEPDGVLAVDAAPTPF